MNRQARSPDPLIARRQAVMALCAEARPEEIHAAVAAFTDLGPVQDLRRPETGLVMSRGRIGGDGAPFNLGEATVTRAAVHLASGETGFAYQLGRDAKKARSAAILDALMQRPGKAEAVEAALRPVAERLTAEREQAERRTAATRVNFFTMVRGED